MASDRDQWADSLSGGNSGGWLSGFLAEEEDLDRRSMWRLGSWGVGAVAAVVVALYANQSSIGQRREQVAAADVVRQSQQIQRVAKESQTEARRLASAIDTLNSDRDRLYSRVNVLEQGFDLVTGSIARPNTPQASPAAAAPPAAADLPAIPSAASAGPAPGPMAAAPATTAPAGPSSVVPASPPSAAPVPSNVASAAPLPPVPAPNAPDKPMAEKSADRPADKPGTVAALQPAPPSALLPPSPVPASQPPAPAAPAAKPEPVSKPEPPTNRASAAAITAPPPPGTPLMPSKSIMAPPDPAASKLTEPDPPADPAAAPTAPPQVVAAVPATSGSEPSAIEAPAAIAVHRTEFGVDLGGANSVDGLRALWRGLLKYRNNKALTELRPIIVVKERSNGLGMQLRLVAGPLKDAAAAAKLCATLTENDRSCETTIFDGQRLAMRTDGDGNAGIETGNVKSDSGSKSDGDSKSDGSSKEAGAKSDASPAAAASTSRRPSGSSRSSRRRGGSGNSSKGARVEEPAPKDASKPVSRSLTSFLGLSGR